MQELIVVGFRGKHRAAEVLEQAQELEFEGEVDLADAVAVYRTDDGKLRLDQSLQMTPKEGGALGGMLGAVLGALLIAPFTVGASAAAAGAAVASSAIGLGTVSAAAGAAEAFEWKGLHGISDDFVRQVGGMVQPGHSAIFALGQTRGKPEAVAEYFRGTGGTILRTTLSPDEAGRLQEVLAAPTR
jgi:uncharacterized membrane protein